MTDLVKKYRIQDALDDLEKNFPKAFVNIGDSIMDYAPDYIPANYDALVRIKHFINEIELNDRSRAEWETRVKKIKSGINHYRTISEMANKLHYSPRYIKEIMHENPKMEIDYARKQRERKMVVLVNDATGERKVMENVSSAAHYIHVPVAFLKRKLRSNWRMKPVNGWRAEKLITRNKRLWQISSEEY